jgi:hypothetical protein
MAGSDSSVRGGNNGDEEPPVSRAEMRNMANSLVETMERMLDERLLAARRTAPHHHDEFSDENSGFGHGFRDHFQCGHGDRGGGRRAGQENRRAGGDRDHDHRVRFDDEDESQGSHEEEYDDDENPFAHCGPFERHRERHRAAGHDGDNRRGHNRADPDSIARVKLSFQKFSGRKMLMHILIGKSSVIKFSECIISLIGDVLALLPLNSMVMPSLDGIKYKKISLSWDVIISTHGLQ